MLPAKSKSGIQHLDVYLDSKSKTATLRNGLFSFFFWAGANSKVRQLRQCFCLFFCPPLHTFTWTWWQMQEAPPSPNIWNVSWMGDTCQGFIISARSFLSPRCLAECDIEFPYCRPMIHLWCKTAAYWIETQWLCCLTWDVMFYCLQLAFDRSRCGLLS